MCRRRLVYEGKGRPRKVCHRKACQAANERRRYLKRMARDLLSPLRKEA